MTGRPGKDWPGKACSRSRLCYDTSGPNWGVVPIRGPKVYNSPRAMPFHVAAMMGVSFACSHFRLFDRPILLSAGLVMDWITGLCLAIMRLIGVRASRLQPVPAPARCLMGRGSQRIRSISTRYSGRFWAVRIPLVGWRVFSVDSLRETFAGFQTLPALWLSRRRARKRHREGRPMVAVWRAHREPERSSPQTRRDRSPSVHS